MTGRPRLRLGLLVDSPIVSRYVVDLLDALDAHFEVRRVALVACAVPPASAAHPAARGPGAAIAVAARTLLRGEALLLRTIGRFSSAVARRARGVRTGELDISEWFERSVALAPGSEAAHRVPDVDLFLALGNWVPPEADFAAGGADLIQLEIGGRPLQNGLLAGFAEADAGLDQTAVCLFRMHRDARPRRCLVRGRNRTRPLFSLNQAASWGRAISLVISYIADRDRGRALEGSDDADVPDSASDVAPGLGRILAYPLRVAWRGARVGVGMLRGQRHWSVAIASTGAAAPVPWQAFQVIARRTACGTRIRFLYRHPVTGIAYCFVEEFDQAAGRAHISVLEQSGNGWQRLGVAIREPFHMSFPYVFEYEGKLHMCPETSEARCISVYRCESFPLGWVHAATLMTDVSAADTVIFQRGQRWWMLSNIDRAPNPDHQSELHAFHADSPLSDRWQPVPGNPVKADCHGARNGGLSVDGSTVRRIGQVQSFEMYGKQVNVYSITRLDEGGFEEECLGTIAPPLGSGAIGMHTYSSVADLVAVDLVGRKQPISQSRVSES